MSSSEPQTATALPTVSAAPQIISVPLPHLARYIPQRPEEYPNVNSNLLPFLYERFHDVLSDHIYKLKPLNAGLAALNSTDENTVRRGDEREIIIGRMDAGLLYVVIDFRVEKMWFTALGAIMKLLEDSGCLSDGNKATFEDLQRLANDFEEDIGNIKDELERLSLLE